MAVPPKKQALNRRQMTTLFVLVGVCFIAFILILAGRTFTQTSPVAVQKNATDQQVVNQVVMSYIDRVKQGNTKDAYGLRTDWYRLTTSQEDFAKRSKTLQADYQKLITIEPDITCAYALRSGSWRRGDKEGYMQITDPRIILYEAQVKLSDGSKARLKAELKHDRQNQYEIEGIQLFGGPSIQNSQIDGSFKPSEKIKSLECRPDLELLPRF